MQADAQAVDWLTRGLAIWGVVLSTALALFEVYKWRRNGKPLLRIRVSGTMKLLGDPADADYMSISVTNVGSAPTTLTGLSYRYFDLDIEPNQVRKTRATEQGLFSDIVRGNVFPVALPIGGEWNHVMLIPDQIKNRALKGCVYIEISDSFTEKDIDNARARLICK